MRDYFTELGWAFLAFAIPVAPFLVLALTLND